MSSQKKSVYYQDHYWNDYFYVKCEILKRMTGKSFSYWKKWFTENPDKSSEDALIYFFKSKYAKKPFKHGLVICCGDGRFCRTFYDLGIVKQLDSFDISKQLIKKAKEKKESRKINYFVADANTINLEKNKYDLVINVAALHHVQFLNKFLAEIHSSMKSNSLFFHFDYISNHRNQFSIKHWAMLHKINKNLLGVYKKDKISYPHIPTMVKIDPSEAIHSELIEDYVDRYFKNDIKHYAGGAIAYMLLHNNHKLASKNKNAQEKILANLMDLDLKLSGKNSYPHLFMFQVSKPKKNLLIDPNWQQKENIREKSAKYLFGAYRQIDIIHIILNKLKLEKIFWTLWQVNLWYIYHLMSRKKMWNNI